MKLKNALNRGPRNSVAVFVVLLSSLSVAIGSNWIDSAYALDLNQQLNIPLNNGSNNASRNQADQLVHLGKTQELDGLLEQAIASWQKALKIYQTLRDTEAENLVYSYLGSGYFGLGRYDEAEDIFRRRLALARDRKDYQGQIYSLNSLGRVVAQRWSVTEAEPFYAEALSISDRIHSLSGKAVSQTSFGLLAFGQNNYDQAMAWYQAALTTSRRAGDAVNEATSLNYLGEVYQAKREYLESLNFYGAALRLTRVTRDRPNQMKAIDGSVLAFKQLGSRYSPQAIELLQERLDLAQIRENPYQELESLQLLAQAHESIGKYPEARQFYQQAIAVARSLGDPTQEQRLLNKLATLDKPAVP